jgi:hypothetical protein
MRMILLQVRKLIYRMPHHSMEEFDCLSITVINKLINLMLYFMNIIYKHDLSSFEQYHKI